MFTICIFVFASLVGGEPTSESVCKTTATAAEASAVAAKCAEWDRDPVGMCTVTRRSGNKLFIELRTIELQSREPADAGAPSRDGGAA